MPSVSFDEHLKEMSIYDLCALYCDYHEWLVSPKTGPSDQEVIREYRTYCEKIVGEIARRNQEAKQI